MSNQLRATGQEKRVIALIASGHSTEEVARYLALSERTVRTYLERVFRRNDYHSRVEAVVAWMQYQTGGARTESSSGSD